MITVSFVLDALMGRIAVLIDLPLPNIPCVHRPGIVALYDLDEIVAIGLCLEIYLFFFTISLHFRL